MWGNKNVGEQKCGGTKMWGKNVDTKFRKTFVKIKLKFSCSIFSSYTDKSKLNLLSKR